MKYLWNHWIVNVKIWTQAQFCVRYIGPIAIWYRFYFIRSKKIHGVRIKTLLAFYWRFSQMSTVLKPNLNLSVLGNLHVWFGFIIKSIILAKNRYIVVESNVTPPFLGLAYQIEIEGILYTLDLTWVSESFIIASYHIDFRLIYVRIDLWYYDNK